MVWFSNMMIPAVTLLAAAAGLLTGRPVFEDFIRGAKEGLKTAAGILPTLVGLMIGTGLLRASGLLGLLAAGVALVVPAALIPPAVIPVILVKLFSSSAATGLALDIFKELGPDSLAGTMTAIILSSTETVFYTMSVYFMSVEVKKTRYTLAGALLAMLTGIAASVFFAHGMA